MSGEPLDDKPGSILSEFAGVTVVVPLTTPPGELQAGQVFYSGPIAVPVDAEVARLRALIKKAEAHDEGHCPWCAVLVGSGRVHRDGCAAFNPDGSVR